MRGMDGRALVALVRFQTAHRCRAHANRAPRSYRMGFAPDRNRGTHRRIVASGKWQRTRVRASASSLGCAGLYEQNGSIQLRGSMRQSA